MPLGVPATARLNVAREDVTLSLSLSLSLGKQRIRADFPRTQSKCSLHFLLKTAVECDVEIFVVLKKFEHR